MRLCFCILVRCLFALHGSLTSRLPRTLVNVLENNLVLRLRAILSQLLSRCFLRLENRLRETGQSKNQVIAGLLVKSSHSAPEPEVFQRLADPGVFTQPGKPRVTEIRGTYREGRAPTPRLSWRWHLRERFAPLVFALSSRRRPLEGTAGWRSASAGSESLPQEQWCWITSRDAASLMPLPSFSALQNGFASPSPNREATPLKSFEVQLWDQGSGHRGLPSH